jgi:hypothetical protein
MAFKIKDGVRIGTVDVFNSNGTLLVNAPTSTKLLNARTISLTGDATGSTVFDGSANVSIEVTIDGFSANGGNAVFTGTVIGDLIGDVYASDGVSKILENGTNGTNAIFYGSLYGNANTATKLETARTINLSGDVTGNVSFDGTSNVTITTVIQPDSVALGTDTTGDYVQSISVTGGTGLSISGTGESAVVTIAGVDANNTVKGVASFSATNFDVISGAVAIKDGGISNAKLVNSSVTIGTTNVELGATANTLSGLQQLTVDNIRIDGNTIETLNANGDLTLSPEGNGHVSVSNSRITNVLEPVDASDAANKLYVDTVAQGLKILPSAKAIAVSNLAATYDNGTLGVGATLTSTSNGAFPTIDGVTLVQGDNILINGQTNKAHNGSYVLTTVGDGSNPWVLTRAAFADQANELAGDFEFVTEGTVYGNTGWVLTVASTPVVVGTTELTWVQFSGAGAYIAGAGLSSNGNIFDVNVDDSSIEIFNDTLRVKAGGVTNAMLANSIVSIAANTGSTDPVNPGETISFFGTNGVTTAVTNNTITISGVDATTTTKGVASFNSSFFTVSSGAVSIANDAIALGVNTTGNYVANVAPGTGIAVTGTAGEGWTPTVALSFLGLQTLTDPNANRIAFYNDSINSFAWLDIGTGLEISGNTINLTQNSFSTFAVSGQSDVVADSVGDTVTFAAGNNIVITTNAGNDTITISATSNTVGDSAFDTKTATVATVSKTTIDSFTAALFRSAKYYVQITQGSNFQVSELMVLHDGVLTYDTEFAVLESNGELGNLASEIVGANVALTVTMGTATSANLVIKRLTLAV